MFQIGAIKILLLSTMVLSLLGQQSYAQTAASCSELQAGESRIIDSTDFDPSVRSMIMVKPKYLLKRERTIDSDAFTAILAINFVPEAPGDLAFAGELLNHANDCYEKLPPITGENGQTLKIRLARSGETAPLTNVVFTNSVVYRESSLHWSTKSECRTIIHESLHLLGLVDLYRESDTAPAGGTKYDCRAIGPQDSVMYWPDRAHFPRYYDVEGRAAQIGLHDASVTGDDSRSLLYLAEFRMITSPGCAEKNLLYYTCASNAYRTQFAGGCVQDLPHACASHFQWLK